jgi:tetratricopeptide (TPR) repeat protein
MTAAGISPRAFTSDAFFEIHPRLGDLVHDVFVDAARRLLAAGEHHRAVDLLQTLSSRGNPNALVALAECYARQGDYHATMQTLSAAVDVLERSPDPGDDEVWHRLLELTLRIEPDDEEARRRLAKLEMRRGKFDAAMGHAAAVVRLAPHDTTSLELVAECLIRAGRTGAGVAALRSILVRHLEAGRHAWARQTLAQAEAWNPAWPEYQDALRALGQRLDLADPKRPPSPQADARSWVNQQRPGRSVSGTIVVEWAA